MRAMLRRAAVARTRVSRFTRMRRDPPDYDSIALTCEQLAAFVTAGLAPRAAWAAVVRAEDALWASAGVSAGDLTIAWNASVRIGAPVAHTCRLLAEGFHARAAIEREIESAMAGPQFARRVMLVLPVFGIFVASALGLDALSFFFGSVVGWACLTFGTLLIAIGWWWSMRLIGQVRLDRVPSGVPMAVAAAALQAGIGMRDARAALDAECDARGAPRCAHEMPEVQTQAARWGIPVADVLVAVARAQRDRVIGEVRRQAAELGEKLLIPLGACVLPAFVLLGVVPVVAQLLMNSGISWHI